MSVDYILLFFKKSTDSMVMMSRLLLLLKRWIEVERGQVQMDNYGYRMARESETNVEIDEIV